MRRTNIYTKTLLVSIVLLILGAQVTECDTGRSLGILEVEKIIKEMNQQELDDFVRAINEDEVHDGPENVVDSEESGKWKAITLFVAGSIAIFLISQYGTTIFQSLSQIGSDISDASINTLLEMSNKVTPEYAIRLARAELQNPISAQKVSRALNYALSLRTNSL